jgi:hypothetical protein
MPGFWSDVRNFAEGLGNSLTSPGPRRLPDDCIRDSAWIDELLEARLSWYFRKTLTSSKARVNLIVLASRTMNPLLPLDNLAITGTGTHVSVHVRLTIPIQLDNDHPRALNPVPPLEDLTIKATDTLVSVHVRPIMLIKLNSDQVEALDAPPPLKNPATTATTRSVHVRLLNEMKVDNDQATGANTPPPLDNLAAPSAVLDLHLMILTRPQSKVSDVLEPRNMPRNIRDRD